MAMHHQPTRCFLIRMPGPSMIDTVRRDSSKGDKGGQHSSEGPSTLRGRSHTHTLSLTPRPNNRFNDAFNVFHQFFGSGGGPGGAHFTFTMGSGDPFGGMPGGGQRKVDCNAVSFVCALFGLTLHGLNSSGRRNSTMTGARSLSSTTRILSRLCLMTKAVSGWSSFSLTLVRKPFCFPLDTMATATLLGS